MLYIRAWYDIIYLVLPDFPMQGCHPNFLAVVAEAFVASFEDSVEDTDAVAVVAVVDEIVAVVVEERFLDYPLSFDILKNE